MEALKIWKNPKSNICELKPEHKGNVRYEVKEKIEKGSYGKVVRAYDTQTKQDVAIKTISFCPNGIRNYAREILLLKNNRHPNRLKLLNIYIPTKSTDAQTLTKIYLVTEYRKISIEFPFKNMFMSQKARFHWLFVAGRYAGQRALDSIINDKRIRVYQENISYMLYQILLAINHMHISGLIHRDLKPENIGVTKAFHIKVLDYGFGRKISSLKMTTKVGTDNYRAPEVLKKLPYHEKIDIWSIGCVFCELLKRKSIVFQETGLLDPIKNSNYNWQNEYGNDLFRPYLNEEKDGKVRKYMSGKSGRDLLSRLMTYDKEKRIDAKTALSHPYVFLYREQAELEIEPDNHDGLEQEMTKELLFELIRKTAQGFYSTDS